MPTPWAQIEPVIRDRAYRRIDAMPELLLEADVPYLPIEADLIYARFIGFDDQVIRDGVPLQRVVPEIRTPLLASYRITGWSSDGGTFEPDPIRTARYVLQSCFTTLRVSGFTAQVPVERLRDDYTAVVAYLRYRRRD